MNQSFRNWQLYRTLPKLSGNMKLDLVVSLNDVLNDDGTVNTDEPGKAYVTGAHLRPLSPYVNYTPIADERLMDRPHQMNIKRFYEKTQSQFYEHMIDPRLASDWPMIIPPSEMPDLKYIKEFDDTYFAGAQRMQHSLYGTTHEVLVPVWLDQARGIKFDINIKCGNEIKTYTLDLSPEYLYGKEGKEYRYNKDQKFHNDFVEYLLNYFDYAGIADGNNNVMSINFEDNMATLRGLQVNTGNILTRQNLNIARNLLFRERPLLEANSLLTNSFMDYKMILPQLINFNLCFDWSEQPTDDAQKLLYNIEVSTKVIRAAKDMFMGYTGDPNWESILDDHGKHSYRWYELSNGDFYTNHHYVPRIKVGELTDYQDENKYKNSAYYNDDDNIINALSYKYDHMCTDLIHENKMAQSICHWHYAKDPDGDQLFNLYDGFGAYATDASGKIAQQWPHGFGSTPDINDTTYNPLMDNAIWAGIPLMVETYSNITKLFDTSGDYFKNFKSLSKFINGIDFAYDPTNLSNFNSSEYTPPADMFVATAMIPLSVIDNEEIFWNDYIGGIKNTIGIIIGYNGKGKTIPSLPKDQLEAAKTKGDFGNRDFQYYDWHLYSDIDNRYWLTVEYKFGYNFDVKYTDDKGEEQTRIEVENGTKLECHIWYDPSETIIPRGSYICLPTTIGEAESDYKMLMTEHIAGQGIKTLQGFSNSLTLSSFTRIGGQLTGIHTNVRNQICVPQNNQDRFKKDPGLKVLYIHSKNINVRNEYDYAEDQKPLYTLFFANEERQNEEGVAGCQALTLGTITKALQEYLRKYSMVNEIVEKLEADEKITSVQYSDYLLKSEDIYNLTILADIFAKTSNPGVLFFNKSIDHSQDLTLSPRAREHTYYKVEGDYNWVYRYSGIIKPCIFPNRTIQSIKIKDAYPEEKFPEEKFPSKPFPDEGIAQIDVTFPGESVFPGEPSDKVDGIANYKYEKWYGRNFLWQKKPIFSIGQSFPSNLGNYINKNIPPLYPSLDYDTVVLCKYSNNSAGDFLYDEVPNIYKGMMNDDDTFFNKGILKSSDFCDKGELDNEEVMRKLIKAGEFDPKTIPGHKVQPREIGYWIYKDEYATYAWPEFKWFNKSQIASLPVKITCTINITENEKHDLENTAAMTILGMIKNNELYADTLDKAYIKKVYNMTYELIDIEHTKDDIENKKIYDVDARTGKKTYKYNYMLTATLK